MNLDQLRDELAQNAWLSPDIKPRDPIGMPDFVDLFNAGWSALLKVLERSGGEFDRGVIENKWNEIGGTGNDSQDFMLRNNACWGAQLQFERDVTRIGLANKLARAAGSVDRIRELEARLAESEHVGLSHEGTIANLKARIKELEAESIAHLLLIDGQAKEIEGLEAERACDCKNQKSQTIFHGGVK